MRPRSVTVDRSIAWFSEGWRLFAKHPGVWLLDGIILFALSALLFLTVVGSLILMLVMPVFLAGMIYGAAQVRAGRALGPEHLFRGFQDPARVGPLLALGGVTLFGTVVILVAVAIFVGPSMVTMMGPDAPHDMMAFGGNGMAVLLTGFIVYLLISAALFYAVPLVMLRQAAPGAAMAASLRACLRNLPALVLFALVYALLAFVATLPLLLGWLVLLPWSACAVYRSYEDVYGGRG